MKPVKSASVRIEAEQVARLREIVDYVPGSSINTLARRAVDLWLEVEGAVYLDAFKKVKLNLVKKRQAVTTEL